MPLRMVPLLVVVLLTVGCVAESAAPPAAPAVVDPQPAAQQVEREPALAISTLALCSAVRQFGVYDPVEPATLPAGKASSIIVYCELTDFQSRQASNSQWETKLTYQATLHSDGDASNALLSRKPSSIVDHCRSRRRDFFLAERMTLPATLPAGRYRLTVTVVDELTQQSAQKTVPLAVLASQD